MSGGRPLTEVQHAGIEEARAAMAERANRAGWTKWSLYGFQAAIVHPVIWVLSILPVDAASAVGAAFGRLVMAPLLRLNRAKLRRTIRVPFPNKSDAECNALVAEMSDNVMRTMAEVAHLEDFAGPDNPRLRIIGTENVRAVRASGRAILFVAGHFANWELAAVATRTIGEDAVVAVQHSHNPFLVRWLARQRFSAAFSEQIGTGDGVYRVMRRRLMEGKAAAMLCDQRVGNGVKAPFFGIETITNVIPARLARTMPIATIPVAARRLGGARFEVEFYPELVFEQTGDKEADDRAFLGRINHFFEQQMLAQPGHWLWLNPRWDDVLMAGKTRRQRSASTPAA